ncbi:hypothetical protein CLAFUW4_14540 [Fulvia fulva]|uniref:Uncharacterized protein n=1 Tax=Passalora fulva TaxID=5499 RepID=A0A9Q8UWD3_PASFU|nr:uncharacterized protein CLAFUR5_14371 [Fulvia fulva]KAK4609141.1 hypothetical protein CLAFUR4_14534 [Fulvia fulva]UJO24896.1 hypothetical protein CLAFUR5_14371 [Fulvia fulva]WPV22470.1 hypothetical protein CLAFUW4_14540 [Fulvia fulva]WPV37728.1 hypothetical protein CLAFUW7_14543 [Fulvia fulva]
MASNAFAADTSPGSSQATSPGFRQALKGDGSHRQTSRKHLTHTGYFDEPVSPAATETTAATPFSHGMSSVRSPLSIASASSWSNDSIHDIGGTIGQGFKKSQPDSVSREQAGDLDIATPASAHLEEPRLPTIQIQEPVDPLRPWLGTTPVPSSRDHDEDEVQEDYGVQTAVAVQVLPSLPSSSQHVDSIEPLQRPHEGNPLDAHLLHFNTAQNAPRPRQVDDKQGILRKKGKRKLLTQKYIF